MYFRQSAVSTGLGINRTWVCPWLCFLLGQIKLLSFFLFFTSQGTTEVDNCTIPSCSKEFYFYSLSCQMELLLPICISNFLNNRFSKIASDLGQCPEKKMIMPSTDPNAYKFRNQETLKVLRALYFTIGTGIISASDRNMTGLLLSNAYMILPSVVQKPEKTSNNPK